MQVENRRGSMRTGERTVVRVLASVLALTGASIVRAQTIPWTIHGTANGDYFGQSIAGGDLDGDGHADIVVGAPQPDPNHLGAGYVRALSGATGAPMFVVSGDAIGDDFGRSVAFVGDLNQDGKDEFVVGAPRNSAHGAGAGLVRVFSGNGGAVMYTLFGDNAGDALGTSLGGVGDVDGDGYGDFIAGAPQTGAGKGYVRLYSGRTGSVIATLRGQAAGDRFGITVSGAGDVDHDSVPDFIVGATGSDAAGLDAGSVYVISGASLAPIFEFDGPSPGAQLGNAIASAGDVNGDGFPDFVLGASRDQDGEGSAFVYSGRNGAVMYHFLGSTDDDFLGRGVAGVGDVDGDGYDDVALAGQEDNNEIHTGMVYVRSGRDGSLLATLFGDQQEDEFGLGLARIGDIDGDGLADVVVGANEGVHNNPRPGYARAYLGCTSKIVTYGSACPGSGASRARLSVTSCPQSGGLYSLAVEGALGGAPAIARFGFGEASIPLANGCTLYLGSMSHLSLPLAMQGSGAGNGFALFQGAIPSSLPSHATITWQVFVFDAGAPGGFAATNPVAITLP
jgi:hypothetical protein